MTTLTSTSTLTFTTSDGVRLAYDDSGGDAAPLVLLHGWGQSRAMFAHQREGLADIARVITMDFRGHGESAQPSHGYRIARLARDLHELLDHLEIPGADLLGWSMGASVLWSYLDLFGPTRAVGTIFVDQPATVVRVPWAGDDETVRSGAILDWAGLIELAARIRADVSGTVVREFVRSMFSGVPADDVWGLVEAEIRIPPRDQAAVLLLDHASQDWRDLLPRVSTPTLVIGCEGSHVSPVSQRFVAASIPGARVHIFTTDQASSHFPFLENPDAFNAVVADFLRTRRNGAHRMTMAASGVATRKLKDSSR